MRSRMRRKAIAAMFELALCGHGGVLPNRRARKEGSSTVSGMLEDISTFLMIQAMTEKTESAKESTAPQSVTSAVMADEGEL